MILDFSQDPFGILSASCKVLRDPIHVTIDTEKIQAAVGTLKHSKVGAPAWDEEIHFQGEPEKLLAYVFVVDTLNFFFWALKDQKRWEISYKGRLYNGYYALALTIKRAFEEGVPLWDPRFLAEISAVEFFSIFEGNGSLPFVHWRHQNIVELGHVTIQRFKGNFENIVKASKGSAVELVKILIENYSSFKDIAKYKGLDIPFLKRAQLLAWDLYLAFKGRGYGNFYDLDGLTAFADYKLPQVLRELGVLRYSKELSDIIDQGITIPQNSPMEVEIRAATVVAVELLKKEFKRQGIYLISPEIDYMLWNLGQKEEFKRKPYHKTPTIYY